MPTPRHVPPQSLRSRWFTTEEAAAAGVHRKQLSGQYYVSVLPHLWVTRETHDAGTMTDTVDGLRRNLPTLRRLYPAAVGSHLTAAITLELRLPTRVTAMAGLHLTVAPGTPAPRGCDVVGHRAALDDTDTWGNARLRVTSPARTIVDLAAMKTPRGNFLVTDDELVAVIDGVINEHATGYHKGKPPLRSRARLAQDLTRLTGLRGTARVRKALARAVVGVDSALETQARLVLAAHGLTGWVTDVELSTPGHRIVWPDLADPNRRIALQIEGAHHDQRGQRVRDIERQRATEAAGWIEIRIVAADLVVGPYDPPGSVPRLIRLVREARAAVV